MKLRGVALYARVSTADQSAESQLTAMREFCNRRGFPVFRELVDQVTGDMERRRARSRTAKNGVAGQDEAYRELLELVKHRRIDCVVVFKYDRLARSLVALVGALEYFRAHGVEFVSLTEDVDTTTAQGRLLFNLIATFAEYEKEVIRERVNAGLANARRKGVQLGRPRDRKMELRVQRLHEKGCKLADIARRVKRSRSGVRLILELSLIHI